MYEAIESMLDTEVMEYVLDILSEKPILQIIIFVCGVAELYACSQINRASTSHGRSVRIGIFIGIGGLQLIAALAFVNHGPDVLVLDIHNLPTLGLLFLFFVLFWFLLGAFLFNAKDGQRRTSEADRSYQRRAHPDSEVVKLSEQLRTEVEIEFLENLLEARRAKLVRG